MRVDSDCVKQTGKYIDTINVDDNFRGRTFVRRIELQPISRLADLVSDLDLVRYDTAAAASVPCGNYSAVYACMCDLHSLPYMDEVAWVCSLSTLADLSTLIKS